MSGQETTQDQRIREKTEELDFKNAESIFNFGQSALDEFNRVSDEILKISNDNKALLESLSRQLESLTKAPGKKGGLDLDLLKDGLGKMRDSMKPGLNSIQNLRTRFEAAHSEMELYIAAGNKFLEKPSREKEKDVLVLLSDRLDALKCEQASADFITRGLLRIKEADYNFLNAMFDSIDKTAASARPSP